MLIGHQTLAINPQGQSALPSAYQKTLGNHLYLTQGFDQNLLLLSEEAFQRIYDCIKATSLTDPLGRLLVRMFLGNASEVELDQNGEIAIPLALRTYASLEDRLQLIGQGDYAELWAPANWDKQNQQIQDHGANADRFSKFQLTLA